MSNAQEIKTAVVAFSGGLDTSMLVPYMREQYALDRVVTCVVDTGGMDAAEKDKVAARAEEVKADEHVYIDASDAFYNEIIKFLIFGNVTRDGYPLCVGAERLIQARETIALAKSRGIGLVANGCTGAGNDQYRFDLVAHVMGDGIESIAPVREHNIKREFSQQFLRDRGISVSEKAKYSYNAGLWGVSIGGDETHHATGLIPESAWYTPIDSTTTYAQVHIRFEQGEPVAMTCNDETVEGPLAVIRALAKIGSAMGIGRHYHVGTSIPGKKGRIAYESPAADILYEAHRTLEKHTLTQGQIFVKQNLANEFGRLIHEAKFFDPLLADLRAFLTSTQARVSGDCVVYLKPRVIEAVTAKADFDLLDGAGSVYGEFADFYDARDAQGSAKLHAYEQYLYHHARSVESTS
jgi:argininosuccinate synthase